MANPYLFDSCSGLPATDIFNRVGGRAYSMSSEHAMAQMAATGCYHDTFYDAARNPRSLVMDLAGKVSPRFIAQTAVYAREHGRQNDLPALLCAILASRDPDLLVPTFARVIDNGRMLRHFVNIMRSGVTGRRSLGSRPKRLIQRWLTDRSAEDLIRDSIGNKPSLADIIKMVHPVPTGAERQALYGFFIGRNVDRRCLPKVLQTFKRYESSRNGPIPKVPFPMLSALKLEPAAWTEIASAASWQTTFTNLNTFRRKGVFDSPGMVEVIAKRLADRDLVRQARVLPFQLWTTFRNIEPTMPEVVVAALEQAVEHAIENIPRFEGRIAVLLDVSGSMRSPANRSTQGATSKVTCLQVAALMVAAVLRRNPGAVVLPFDHRVRRIAFHPKDSVAVNAHKLAVDGGGTDCAAPLRFMLHRDINVDTVLLVSDTESWLDRGLLTQYQPTHTTETMEAWNRYRTKNRGARLVCLDIQPTPGKQAVHQNDILNLGGFSDHTFSLIQTVTQKKDGADLWVNRIKAVEL